MRDDHPEDHIVTIRLIPANGPMPAKEFHREIRERSPLPPTLNTWRRYMSAARMYHAYVKDNPVMALPCVPGA
jgi:hypothetical protein